MPICGTVVSWATADYRPAVPGHIIYTADGCRALMIEPRAKISAAGAKRRAGRHCGGAGSSGYAQPAVARGDELGRCPRWPRRLGDDQARSRGRAAGADVSGQRRTALGERCRSLCAWQPAASGLVHQPQQIVVFGMVGKTRQRLLARWPERPASGSAGRDAGGRLDIGQMVQGVGRGLAPRGTLKRGQRVSGSR